MNNEPPYKQMYLGLRVALVQAVEAMEAFTDPCGNMPAATGEFNALRFALKDAKLALYVCKPTP